MKEFSTEKKLVRSLNGDIENADCKTIENVLKSFVSDDYEFKGFHPYGGEKGVSATEACERFWRPMLNAIRSMQRREDIFIGQLTPWLQAGANMQQKQLTTDSKFNSHN